VSVPFNLAAYFVDRHVLEGHGAKVAVLSEGRQYSYAQVAALVNQAGNALRRAGVEPGHRVMIVLPDSIEFVAAYFGAMKIGAVAVPTSTALRQADYAYLMEESQAKIVISENAPLECGGDSQQLTCASTVAHDPAFWLWTSGSTGPPKAAVHSHQDWLACCEG